MKGLRKYIPPFAPDQSGAVAVFFELGGIVVICDAGGCTGNVCGFDEPRWFEKKSAVFSAGLRDMDAILGRDDKLVEKLADAANRLGGKFAAVVGTPVPAVIATDYKALCRMAEKKTDLPVLYTGTTGMQLYDKGASEAYLSLFEGFTEENQKSVEGRIGVLGVTPLDVGESQAAERMKGILKKQGWKEVWCYGAGAGIEEIQNAASVEKNMVVAPSGLSAARWMEKKFGISYETAYPLLEEQFAEEIQNQWKNYEKKKILIVHQQILANDLRRRILETVDADITVASWFMIDEECSMSEDIHLKEEDQWVELVTEGNFDIIIGDLTLKKAIPKYTGEFISLPHFAVSGQKGQQQERA